jgi:hypothetical protein
MSCVLRASGTNFDVDSFLRDSCLDALTIFHRGEVQFPKLTTPQRIREYSGMNVSVSTREFSDLNGQREQMLSNFSHAMTRNLRRLRDFPGVERIDLDFPVEARDVIFQSDAFPPRLLSLLGGLCIGLVVSRYPVHSEAKDQTSAK